MRMFTAAAMLLAATLSASAQNAVPPDVMKDLAPTGKVRAAINFGNGVLAQKGPNGEPKGITPDLATALAKRLGVAVEFVPYEAAGKVFLIPSLLLKTSCIGAAASRIAFSNWLRI